MYPVLNAAVYPIDNADSDDRVAQYTSANRLLMSNLEKDERGLEFAKRRCPCQ